MNKNERKSESPFLTRLGFGSLLEFYDKNPDVKASLDLVNLEHRDKLIEGLSEGEDLAPYQSEIEKLLNPLFPPALSTNEIKAATWPMSKEVIRVSTRFDKTIDLPTYLEQNDTYNLSDEEFYIMQCTFILFGHYDVTASRPFNIQYQQRDARGLLRSYKVLFNADHVNMSPVGAKPEISKEQISQLLNNPKNYELWRNTFPPQSWEVNGFLLLNMFDNTFEYSLSRFKNLLLANLGQDANYLSSESQAEAEKRESEVVDIMRSLFGIPDLKGSLKVFDDMTQRFDMRESRSFGVTSDAMLQELKPDRMCSGSKHMVFDDHETFVITDLHLPKDKSEIPAYYHDLYKDGVRSYLMAPLIHQDKLLGVFEFASSDPYAITAGTKIILQEIQPITTATMAFASDVKRKEIQALVQREFTSIHPSVAWKFGEKAREYLMTGGVENDMEDIVFPDLYALFGQSDIVGSSRKRNEAIVNDLSTQLKMVEGILQQALETQKMPIVERVLFLVTEYIQKLEMHLEVNLEQKILLFLRKDVSPLLQVLQQDEDLRESIQGYYDLLDPELGFYYDQRQAYESSVDQINIALARYLDAQQIEAQKFYPHYFERYKTDGVEHNIFVGQAIAPRIPFNKVYLDNLRLWQMLAMVRMHLIIRDIGPDLAMPMEVASLAMVYSNTLAIRYRIDEKRFDVDGAYNARYEIIKKRIDKSRIKGTNQRLTLPGKIAVVFIQSDDIAPYQSIIDYLKTKNLILDEVELLEIEDLQGITGLKALRFTVNLEADKKTEELNSIFELEESETSRVEKIPAV